MICKAMRMRQCRNTELAVFICKRNLYTATVVSHLYLKAYAVYPTQEDVENKAITLNFDASKLIALRLVDAFNPMKHRLPNNLLKHFCISMAYLPDEYEKNSAGIAQIPYHFEKGDLSAIKQAILDGGMYVS